MNTTNTILKLQRKKVPSHLQNNIISYVASFFSIIFSMSLVEQANKFIEEKYVLYLVVVFIILFLVFNEYHKVIELRKRFMKLPSSMFIIIFTVSINVFMSAIGIYLWTNKTFENTIKNNNETSISTLSIEKKYSSMIDSVNRVEINQDPIYRGLMKDLSYWKSRQPADLEERSSIRLTITEIQDRIDKFNNNFLENKEKSIENIKSLRQAEIANITVLSESKHKFILHYNNIAMVFFLMVIMTKLIIIFLAKEHAEIEVKLQELITVNEKFLSEYKIITDIYSRKKEISFNDVVFSKYRIKTNNPKDTFYLFGDLSILKTDMKTAQNTLKNYYETIINL